MDALRIAFCCLASYGAGRLASRCRLPAITGMMMAGLVLGPEVLGLLTPESISKASPLEHSCLALIAMVAGMELVWEDLARSGRQVAWCTLGISAGSWLTAGAAVVALISLQGAESLGLPPGATGAAASLCATLALARSPASAVAVIREVGGSGPFCSLVLAVTVLKDVLLFVLFALNLELVALSVGHQTTDAGLLSSWMHVGTAMAGRVAVSLSLGVLGGAATAHVLTWRGLAGALQRLGGSTGTPVARQVARRISGGGATLLATVVAVSTAAVAVVLRAELLLACVMLGIAVQNNELVLGPPGLGTEQVQALHAGLGQVMAGVNPVFFCLVGAHLQPRLLVGMAPHGVALAIARAAGIVAGAMLSGAAGRVPGALRLRLAQGMVTQAGIALGLCRVIARRFPDWGPALSSMITAAVLVNLAIGPILFRAAIISVGEAANVGSRADIPKRPPSFKRSVSKEIPTAAPTMEIPVITV